METLSMRNIIIWENSHQNKWTDPDTSIFLSNLMDQVPVGIRWILEYNGEKWIEIWVVTRKEIMNIIIKNSIKGKLSDFGATFTLFSDWLALAKRTIGDIKTVELYIADINHPNFIESIDSVSSHAKSIILEIKNNDHGLIWTTTLENIRYCQKIGYKICIHAFNLWTINPEWENNNITDQDIISINLEKLFKGNINPEYIKIHESLYKILYPKIWDKNYYLPAKEEIKEQIQKRSCELVVHESYWDNLNWNIWSRWYNPVIPEFLKKSTVKDEYCIDIEWNIKFTEALTNFAEWVTTPQWLKELKEKGITESLMIEIFNQSLWKLINWENISINLYLKDIWSHAFIEALQYMTTWLPSYKMRKKVILEILEEPYGSINNAVISNLKRARELWFSVAIDDFCVSDNQNWLSREILIALYENGINLDLIKIDGKHIMDIYTNSIDIEDLKKLRQLIRIFTQKWVTFVAEWIQNKKHADLVVEKIACPESIILFQWRNIKQWWK